ncbi:TRAM domain-containing protein [Haloarcula marismortui]|uniref:TRAM domain-containing protein n=1 Tax=Haloarcula marismortui TaxID=2238 RepID=UPI000324E334|nr:TRAM domain-containing protein [Haloarcula californiae]
MNIPSQLRCLFAGTVEERNDSYVIEVPKQELQTGSLQADAMYRVALLSLPTDTESPQSETEPQSNRGPQEPPVTEGEQRIVDIEDLGDQGDGLARVERGFVVIVPDTEVGERVTVEITDVRENVAFAEVVARGSSSE